MSPVLFALFVFWWLPVSGFKISSTNADLAKDLLRSIYQKGAFQAYFASTSVLCDQLKAFPWVQQCRVDKLFPNHWHVELVYETPVLLWEEEGSLISRSGRLMPSHAAIESPKVALRGNKADVHLSDALVLLDWVGGNDQLKSRCEAITYDRKSGWRLLFDHQLQVVLGRHQLKSRWLLFINMLDKKKFKPWNNQLFDMRYHKGFSHVWLKPLS